METVIAILIIIALVGGVSYFIKTKRDVRRVNPPAGSGKPIDKGNVHPK